jgi:CDP-L-myo-inositol myo-inositolphosphotransferase
MAFDSNARPAVHSAWRALIAPADARSLARRIAGLSVLSRQLIELCNAGVGQALVLGAPPPGLVEEARADLRRSGCSIEIEIASRSDERPTDVLLLDGSVLIRARALGLLMRRDAPARDLTLAGRVVARRLRPGAPVELAGAPEAASAIAGPMVTHLDPRWAADRAILRGTSKPSDGLVSRYLNRPLSRLVSGWLLRVEGIRPVHATAITAVSAFAMFLALIQGRPGGLVLGCLLFHLTSVLDGVDGEIARATFRASRRGAAMDTTVDMLTNLGFALGLTIGLSRLYADPYPAIGAFSFLGLLAGMGVMTVLVRRGPDSGSFDILKTAYRARAAEGGWRLKLVKVVQTATSRDFFAFVFALLGLAGLAWTIAWILAFGVALWLLVVAGGASMLLVAERPARS